MRVVFKSFNLTIAVPFIIFLNTFVFLMWQFSSESPNGFMARNFLVSWDSIIEGRFWTLVTSAFSHNMFLHFFINMYVFFGFGRVIEQMIGARKLFKFYFYAGIASSLAHSLVCMYLLNDPSLPALGASGSVAGIILLFSLLFPREKILLLGIIPMPAIFGALVFVGLDLWGLSAQLGGHGLPIGHGAHLGGALFGAVYYWLYIRPNLHRNTPPQRDDVIDVEYEKIT